jgi:hypothetical protein
MLASAAAAAKNAKKEDVEVNEMGETDFIPNTSFGGAKEIFGAGLPQFDDNYVQAAVKAKAGVYGANDKVQAAGLKLSKKRSTTNSRPSLLPNFSTHLPCSSLSPLHLMKFLIRSPICGSWRR